MATDSSVGSAGSPRTGPSRALRDGAWYVVLTALSLLVLFPIYMTVVRALSNPVAYVRPGHNPLLVADPEWGVFGKAFGVGKLGSAFMRSVVMTVIITGAQLLTSVLAAYAFAFLRFPLKKLVFALFIATMMLPLEVTFIANVQTIRQWHWIDSLQGLTAPFLATAFGAFLIRQGFMGIPSELREAAHLDGYGHLSFLFRHAIPLARPVVASFGLIAFLSAWNQYLWPRAVIETQNKQTLQIALQSLGTARPQEFNVAVAGAVIAAVPIFILLVIFQRQIIRGLTAGAVKG